MSIVDNTKYYRGHDLRVNNSKKLRYIRLIPGERTIEYDPEFFSKLNKEQQFFLLNWAINSRLIKDPYKCDRKTMVLYQYYGYDPVHVMNMYASMQFASKQHKERRMLHLVTTPSDKGEQIIERAEKTTTRIEIFFNNMIEWISQKMRLR